MADRADDTFQRTFTCPDGSLVRLSHAHGRLYVRIKQPGARAWCTAPVDVANWGALISALAWMLDNERAARAARQQRVA